MKTYRLAAMSKEVETKGKMFHGYLYGWLRQQPIERHMRSPIMLQVLISCQFGGAVVLISLISRKREIIVTLVTTLMRGSHTRESINSVSTIEG